MPVWFPFLFVVIIILAVWGGCSITHAIWDLWKQNSLKNDKTYQVAYKQLMKHDSEIAELIDDLNKFKIEDLKQRKQRLLEDHLRISDETSNTIDEKVLNFKKSNFPSIVQTNVFIHDEEIKLLKRDLDRLRQKLEAKK